MTTYQVNIVVQGQDRASGPLGAVSRSLGGLGKIAGGILTAGAISAIGRGIFDLGKQALDSYANYERLGMSLQSLVARELVNTGQANNMAEALSKASGMSKELLDWTEELGIKSPFTSEHIAAAFQQAMSYGFATDEAKRLTQATLDYAAAAGKGPEVMDSISRALGQIRAKGKLAGGEVLQLTEAGIPVTAILAKAFGVTTAEIIKMQEKGLIPADKAIQAITESLEKDFPDAAARQAGSFSGLISSLEEIKTIGLRTFFEGTFKAIQPYVQGFVDKFSDPAFKANLSAMGEKLGNFVANGIKAFLTLQNTFESFTNSPAMKTISESLQKVFKVIQQPAVLAAAQQIFGGIKTFLTDLGAKVLPFAVQMFDKLGAWFTSNGPLIGAYVQQIADNFTNFLLPVLMLVWDVAAPLLNGLMNIILGFVKMTMQLFTGDWAGAWATFLQIARDFGVAVWNAILALFAGIASMMGTSLAQLGATWSSNWNQFVNILRTIWEIMKAAIAAKINEIVSNVTGFVQRMINALNARISQFKNLGNRIVDGLRQGIVNAFVGLISEFEGLIEMLPDAVKTILGIASPSKVMQWMGMQMMAGLAKGISANSLMPQVALDNALSSFTGGGIQSLSNYQSNSTDSSQKYYAPVYVTVQQPDASVGDMLKGLRKR